MRLLIIVTCLLLSCSGEDIKPQKPCEQIKTELDAAQKALTEHKAKGSVGDQDAWLNKLNNLIRTRDEKQAEYTSRYCL